MVSNNKSGYYCKLCDKSLKLRHKKKHLSTQSHRALPNSIITRCPFESPGFFEIEDILEKDNDD